MNFSCGARNMCSSGVSSNNFFTDELMNVRLSSVSVVQTTSEIFSVMVRYFSSLYLRALSAFLRWVISLKFRTIDNTFGSDNKFVNVVSTHFQLPALSINRYSMVGVKLGSSSSLDKLSITLSKSSGCTSSFAFSISSSVAV